MIKKKTKIDKNRIRVNREKDRISVGILKKNEKNFKKILPAKGSEIDLIKSEIKKPTKKFEYKNEILHPAKKFIRISDKEVKKCSCYIKKLKSEISKSIIGQAKVIDGLIKALICDGHVLLEGVPGVAKTLAIKSLGTVSGCDVKRVQFTVDLLPTDIIGITTYTPGKGFDILKGPIFTNFIIADEINRSPPKTQSALIEAMQEKQVTIGKETMSLPNPFFVMATINPLESEGVYILPEAQVDRFLFKLKVDYPKTEEERLIMEENMTLKKFDDFNLKPVMSPKEIIYMQKCVQKVYLDERIKSYILEIVNKTRDEHSKFKEYVAYGASPRATIALFLASKANALMNGRNFVLPEDIKEVIFDVLRHRLILSYQASVKGIKSEEIIRDILNETNIF